MKLLGSLLNKRQTKKTSLTDKDVYYIFRKIIQEEFGAVGIEKLVPDYFDGKTIFVKSESSAWLSELWTNKGRIMRKINEEIGEEIVKNIKTK
jgi:predicted nucleic acid-binding Zn ribbon protein